MISPTLLEIDRSMRGFSLEEQMWLLERLVKQLREKTHTQACPFISQEMEEDLAAMASDPDIQAEIAAIDEGFAVAELDGLEKLSAFSEVKSIL